MIKNSANALTGLRILCSGVLLFAEPFGILFYFLYITAGVTDVADGLVARKCNGESKFGAKFDTVADFIFVICAMVKILPLFEIPIWIYVWLAVIFVVKTIAVLRGNTHTLMNKITGFLLFVFILVLPIIDFNYGLVFLCIIATISAIQESFCI